MDTYVMKKELFIDLIKKGHDMSSMYTLPQVINIECSELDIRGVSHRGFFAAITDLKAITNRIFPCSILNPPSVCLMITGRSIQKRQIPVRLNILRLQM